jgi:hypothetical protein
LVTCKKWVIDHLINTLLFAICVDKSSHWKQAPHENLLNPWEFGFDKCFKYVAQANNCMLIESLYP